MQAQKSRKQILRLEKKARRTVRSLVLVRLSGRATSLNGRAGVQARMLSLRVVAAGSWVGHTRGASAKRL